MSGPRARGSLARIALVLTALPLLQALSVSPAHAIPAFARKYRVSCVLCHSPFPRLNAFGETFAGNGFEFAVGEVPVDTVDTGDPTLRLQELVPLAIRVDAYLAALAESGEGFVATDLQTPYNIKVLSGGQIADKVSYYFYFFMSERGEIAGLEDAYIQFSDIGGSGISLIAGQFQVSDPLFKRELRLEYEDYQAYRVRVGDTRADLTYDRGLMAAYSPWEGGDLVLQLVNGQGLDEASIERLFDVDKRKNVAARFSQQFGQIRLGAFGYFGKESAENLSSSILAWGPDATISLGPRAELNAQYLRRTDENPFFLLECEEGDFRCDPGATDPLETNVDAVLAELLFFPEGATGPWALSVLYNWVDAGRQVMKLRLGEQESDPPFLERYHAGALGASYLMRRNLRAVGELQWDFDLDRARFTLGVVAGF